ncbi:MAG: histidine kinase [Propionibacteriaceae bacterium]|nr:histidine kinase [Propionibacteriaceae bacterium]
MALILAMMTLVFHGTTGSLGWALVLDLAIYSCAALYYRFPRLSAVTVFCLLVVLAGALDAPSMGELAALIPILGFGLRGLWRPQLACSVAYYVALMCGAALVSFGPELVVPGAFWFAGIAIVWVIGGIFHRSRRHHEDKLSQSLSRQRILLARELHDTIAHDLTSIALQAEVARNSSDNDNEAWTNVANMSRSALADLRSVITLLRTDPTDQLDAGSFTHASVLDTLEEASGRLSSAGFTVDYNTSPEDAVALRLAPAGAIYPISREAINNIIQHGDPDESVHVNAAIEDGFAEVSFKNKRSSRAKPPAGLGITGMAERAALVGGHVVSCPSNDHWLTQVSCPVRSAHDV